MRRTKTFAFYFREPEAFGHRRKDLCTIRAHIVVVILLMGLLAAVPLFGQGFSVFNGRNHPELDWQVAETEHFEIMYPQRLAGIAAEAAPIAEASYDALSENLGGVTFDDRIRIYLSDEDEIANGIAFPIGDGFTAIWVHPGDVATIWTGEEKWLRKVIAHELAHIFHYRATRSNIGLLGRIISNPTPSFWTEGLAQYQTEVWDAQRGDRWLRTAVLDDELSYRDGRSIWNGRLRYAVGNSQVRYFADTYGDTTLANLLEHRSGKLFGLIQVHDLDDAFEATIDQSYRDFYDEWRRHVNIYYNTLAGHLVPTDSLDGRVNVPGQYLYDLNVSPADTSRMAVLSLTSVQRPVRRLFVVHRKEDGTDVEIVAEGGVNLPVSWSPDGRRLAYSRTVRGEYGSLLNDLFVVDADGDNRRRLTRDRRAVAPSFAPDGRRIAFAAMEGGTANIFVLDLETGEERPVTSFIGDVQISSVRWHPLHDSLAFARFGPDGTRDIALLDLATGRARALTSGTHDDRSPVWSYDGARLAYTSLRDDVPNVFILEMEQTDERRVTNLATGATAHDWLPPDSANAEGTLLVSSGVSKTQDRAYRVPATDTPPDVDAEVPPQYAQWTTHRPPLWIPSHIAPDTSLISQRYDYSSLRNLTHVVSFGWPYYNHADDWGVFGFTSWIEPLGKHQFAAYGGLSVSSLREESYFWASYANSQLYPTVALTGYLAPGSARIYGDELLVEKVLGGSVGVYWPLDWFVQPYTTTRLGIRLRYRDVEPLNVEDFEGQLVPPQPQGAQEADVRVSFEWKKQRPYEYNLLHPLDGLGVRLETTAAAEVLGADTEYLRGDLAAFGIFESLGRQRLYLYGRGQAQTGAPLPQNFLGLSRLDEIQLNIPGYIPLELGDAERVRGFQSFAFGDRMLFGTAEYRVPVLRSLNTELLGLLDFGATAVNAFADVGAVWSAGNFDHAVRRVGAGFEAKNLLRVVGLPVTHALGVAWPVERLSTTTVPGYDYEIYYRIRTAIPF